MKRIGLLILVLALILAGVFLLNPGGGGGLDMIEENPGPDLEESVGSSVGLSGQEGLADAVDAVANPSHAGLAEAGRSRMETGAVGEIHGRVLDLLSEPVAGATLFLYRQKEARRKGAKAPILARAESDERGFFKMRGLELQGYSLRVSAEGWAETQLGVELSQQYPKRLGLILRIQEGHSVGGVVVDKSGKAVAEAWVVASVSGGIGPWQEVRSDQEGCFTLSSLPSAKLQVLAWAEGYSLGLMQLDENRTESLRVELPDAGPFKIEFSLAAQAKDGTGRPEDVSASMFIIANNVTLPLPSPIRMLRVPTKGKIVTKGLCEGTYQITFDSVEVALEKTWHRQELTNPKPEAKVELAWSAALRLEGKLVFENGQPASGIALQTWTQNRHERFSVESDKEGRFAFPKRFRANAQTYVSLVDPGFAFKTGKSRAYWVQIKPGEKDKVLTLVPTSLLSGRVVDEKNQAVPGARVWLHLPDRNWGGYGQTTADENGEFRFSSSRGSKKPLLLDASYDSMYCAKPVYLEGQERPSRDGLLLRLIEGAWIEGKVVNDKGVGIASANISASFIPKPRPKGAKNNGLRGWVVDGGFRGFNSVRSRSARTNSEGKFRIRGLTPGSWRVSARKAGRMKRGVDPVLQLAQGEKRSGLKLVLDQGLSIEGLLLTDAGKPLTGATISARFDGKLAKGESGGRANTQSGSDGRFSLAGLRPGKFKLTARLPWQMQNDLGLRKPGPDGKRPMRVQTRIQTSVMAGIKDYRWLFTLPRFGEIRARFAQSGKPLQRIQVLFRDGKQSWNFDLPVVQGAVHLKRVLVGSYDLTFRSSRYSDLMTKVQVHPDQVADLGLLNLVDLERVEGRVTDEQGQAIAGVWISLDGRVARLWPNYNISKGPEQFDGRVLTQSDAMGRFTVPTKGRLRVYGFKPGYAPGRLTYRTPGSKPVSSKGTKSKRAPTKKGAANKELILILKRAGEISVQAPATPKGQRTRWFSKLSRVPDAPPPPGKKAPRPWTRSISLKPGKSVRFLGLSPGLYRLEATDYMKGRGFTKKSVPGESYYEEFLIQTGTNRLIKIP